VGIEIQRKVGDHVEMGDPLFTVHANDLGKLESASARILAAHQFADDPVPALPLFYDIIGD
jgi:pyrimidine-nucleoside phosphorylase